MKTNETPLLLPEGRVLSTLESDGSRRWLTPKLAPGRYWARRRWTAYGLIALYALLPWLRINGRPALQFDLWNGRFSVLGAIFLPTDFALLALLALTLLLGVFFATAVFGRVWCGWACPQTVYLEFVYRPIERLLLGTSGKGGRPTKVVAPWRVGLMYALYLLISWHLANTFLAYFVGARELNEWIWTAPPWRHPGAFALVLLVTGLMMFDFCYWREQLCIIGCPYGRFQSVMLDRSSVVVGYDVLRGEPRGRGRERETKGLGDCVDCLRCVDVCPTGIDIRDGLQLECVHCAQCVDACDAVMAKLNRPLGLVGYGSQARLEGGAAPRVRWRLFVYSTAMLLLGGALIALLVTRSPMQVTLLRGLGRPFVVRDDGRVENLVRVNIVNRTDRERLYRVEAAVESPHASAERESVSDVEGESTLRVGPQSQETIPVHVLAPREAFASLGGVVTARFRVTDDTGASSESEYTLFGPASSDEAPPREAAGPGSPSP